MDGLFKHIEKVGRTCYKSEDKITTDSSKVFVDKIIKNDHGAMLEHGTIYLRMPYHDESGDNLTLTLNDYTHHGKWDMNEEYAYYTTNYRVSVENNLLYLLKYQCEPTEFHEKRITVKFICDRGVSHEFVRHRVFSFAQESTRRVTMAA